MTCPRDCPCRGNLPADAVSAEPVPLSARLWSAFKDWRGVIVLSVALAVVILA